jgi:hypothetical protein
MSIKRAIYLVLGCVSLVLGCVGAVLPLLPTVPFLLLTAYCFARSSQRLNDWFRGTKLYKEHLESYVQKKGMTMRTKLTILGSVSLLMGIGFLMMSRVPVGRAVLAVVWAVHVIYFLFGVKTIS